MQPLPTFLVLNGEAIEGPYTAGQLRAMEDRGAINGDTPIARHGEAEWLPLEVWREVIHGAPTHRGPIPGGIRPASSTPSSSSSAGSGKGLTIAAVIVALIGVVMTVRGLTIEGAGGWGVGAGILGFALVLWMLGSGGKQR